MIDDVDNLARRKAMSFTKQYCNWGHLASRLCLAVRAAINDIFQSLKGSYNTYCTSLVLHETGATREQVEHMDAYHHPGLRCSLTPVFSYRMTVMMMTSASSAMTTSPAKRARAQARAGLGIFVWTRSQEEDRKSPW